MKRGSSGLSLVVPVSKPQGMTSHDVVNRCRRIFNERRVGHTGTLDPLATGVLPICVGPATRLDRFMTGHDKRYRVTVAFGRETTTDDCEGETMAVGEVREDLLDGTFADAYVSGLQGIREQVPPRYSAVKVAGRKAYEIARKGGDVELKPRRIEVYEAKLVKRDAKGGLEHLTWTIDLSVSKGTYIRALVRDMGRELGACAHVAALERRSAGSITLADCMALETVEQLKEQAAIDPVRMLGYRFAYADDLAKRLENGSAFPAGQLALHEYDSACRKACSCMSDVRPSDDAAHDGELISVISGNRLKAIYSFSEVRNSFVPECVFSQGVIRG